MNKILIKDNRKEIKQQIKQLKLKINNSQINNKDIYELLLMVYEHVINKK